MNRITMSFLPLVAVACAAAQPPVPTASVTESGRIARFVAGPGDRPQGALLRNGTFVTFSPGLAQRLPATLPKSATIQVVGERFSYAGTQTIQARTVTIAGVSYNDGAPAPGGPDMVGRPGPGFGPVGAPPPPPPPQPGVAPPPPAGRGGPPSPMPNGAPPPPPSAPAPAASAGGPAGVGAPPPPASGAAVPPPPSPTEAAPAMQPAAPAPPPQ